MTDGAEAWGNLNLSPSFPLSQTYPPLPGARGIIDYMNNLISFLTPSPPGEGAGDEAFNPGEGAGDEVLTPITDHRLPQTAHLRMTFHFKKISL